MVNAVSRVRCCRKVPPNMCAITSCDMVGPIDAACSALERQLLLRNTGKVCEDQNEAGQKFLFNGNRWDANG